MKQTMSHEQPVLLSRKVVSRRVLSLFLCVLMVVTFLTGGLLSADAATLVPDTSPTVLPSAGLNYDQYPSLKDVYKDYFMIGTTGSTSGSTGSLVMRNFNAFTPENAMKPEQVQRNKGTFTYSSADSVLNGAAGLSSDMNLIGHTLAWHSQSPTWMWDAPNFNYATALNNLNNHIDNVLGHFGGRLYSVDVINEAMADTGTANWKDRLKEREGWAQALGWEWIELAFIRAAKVVDENGWDCKLVYNDYGLSGTKAKAVYDMVKDINERYAGHRTNGKLLIEGIGIQGHENSGSKISDMEDTIKLFATLPGVLVSLTEVDIEWPNTGSLTTEQSIKQGQKYAELFQMLKKYAIGPANTSGNPKVIDRVTFWGSNDGASWKAGGKPLPFDSNLRGKEALIGVLYPNEYLEAHPIGGDDGGGEIPHIDGVYVYATANGDATSGANIILGNNADVWPWSMAGDDGKIAFTPEKEATYRITVNYTSMGTNGLRIRWIKDATNGGYTVRDGAVVNTSPYSTNYRPGQVAPRLPALFNSGMVSGGTYTVAAEVKLDGSQPAEGLIGNIGVRGISGGTSFVINTLKVEKIGTGGASDKLLVNWPDGVPKSDDELVDLAVQAIEEGTYAIPYAVRTNQDTRNAWVQSEVNALIPSENGSTAVVTYDNGYVVSVSKGTVTKLAAITVTESGLNVTTTANLVKKGDYFDVTASLPETTTVNAVSFVLNYDPDKFEYCGNLGADPAQDSYIDGVTYLTSDVGDGNVKLTLMIPDYKAKDLVSLRFRAKENADIQNADNSITATADLVYKTSEGSKFVFTVSGSTEFTSSGNPGDTDEDGKVTLLDLSNVIDMFGVKSGDALWTKARFYDFNKNKVIDIADIVAVAKLIF